MADNKGPKHAKSVKPRSMQAQDRKAAREAAQQAETDQRAARVANKRANEIVEQTQNPKHRRGDS